MTDASHEAKEFSVVPDQLRRASQDLGRSSAGVRQIRDDTVSAPPSSIFGLLPEASELAQALADSVAVNQTDLSRSATRTEHIGGLLADGSERYVDLDRHTAGMINGGGTGSTQSA